MANVAASEAKKVGGVKKVGGAAPAPESGKKAKVKKVAYDIKTAPKAELDENGKLKVSKPSNYSFDTNKPMKKGDFGMTYLFMQHRADLIDQRAKKMADVATKMRAKADRMSKLGDEKTAKTVKKAERIAKELSSLKAQLEAAGIDINELLSADAKEEAPAAK